MEGKKRKTWNQFLTEFGFCKANQETGNRPCDSGDICDKCEMPWVQETYKKWLEEDK